MIVHFIGAGPGAPDLLTLRAQRLIASCPVCLYAGALVPTEVLEHAPSDARLIDTQHLDLDQIVAERRERIVHILDQQRQIGHRHTIVADMRGDDVCGQSNQRFGEAVII